MNEDKVKASTLIFKTASIDAASNTDKIYIREQFGFFQKIRRYMSWSLTLIFVLLPLIRWNGQQAILFDIGQQKIRFFSVTFFPQDLFIFALLFILAAFCLFFITKKYGRVWCGYTCPQTVWVLMFNWVERRIEGSNNKSKALDKAPLTYDKVIKKFSKHAVWIAISLLTSLVFMSYFTPAKDIYVDFISGKSTNLIFAWILFFAVCTYVNAAWIKEKMCLHMCPYARFQSVMFDNSSLLVTYDKNRGESRGARIRKSPKPSDLGDCVNCQLCVQVCPVGIDIRDGLQYECINCGLCVDACDEVMDKFSYSKGLIKYARQSDNDIKNEMRQSRYFPSKRLKGFTLGVLGYGISILLTLSAIVIWIDNRDNFEVSIFRDRHGLYRINAQGHVENTYLFKTYNKTQVTRQFRISATGIEQLKLAGEHYFTVAPESQVSVSLALSTSVRSIKSINSLEFVVEDIDTGDTVKKTSSFFAGEGAW